jgi:hypothetical protein
MSMSFSKYFVCLVTSIALSACGGGGGSPGAVPGSTAPGNGVTPDPAVTGTTPEKVIPVAADFIFELDKTSIVNSGLDKVVLTVLAVDKSRNVVSGVPVSVAVDSDGVFAGSSATTDSAGKFTGNITIGGNKSNRTINATITASGLVKVASVVVTGSQIKVTPVPAEPAPGELVKVTILTLDSANSPIQNAALVLNGTAGASGTVTTDASGVKLVSFIAPTLARDDYTVVVTGLGVSATSLIRVVAPGGTQHPNAVGEISSFSLSAQPTSIAPNAAGATTSRSRLTAKFLTTNNAGLKDMRVRFQFEDPQLGSGEAISSGNSIVYSDASGLAETDYIAGTRSSPTNGVKVKACYKATDFTSATDCPNSVFTNLTVAGTPLSISISDDNKMSKGLGDIAYVKQFLIQVNDSAGVAVKDAIVSASVDITHYGKGTFAGLYPYGATPPTIADESLATALVEPATTPPTTKVITSIDTKPGVLTGFVPYFNIWCANEDKNRNGFIDLGEDINGDRVLQPRKAEIIVSYVSGNRTDASGQMLIQVTYGQNMGTWLAYTLRATTGVAGSEGDASKSYITDVLQADVANGSFRTPPFGSNACNTVN